MIEHNLTQGGNVKKRLCYLWVVIGVIWILGGNDVLGQQNHFHSLALVPGTGTLLVGTHQGLFETRDEGKTWRGRAPKGNVPGIAQRPASQRDAARLLVLDRESGALRHRRFSDLVALLQPGDLLVLNDTHQVTCFNEARLTTDHLFKIGEDAQTLPSHGRGHRVEIPHVEVCSAVVDHVDFDFGFHVVPFH